jgi:surface antigen
MIARRLRRGPRVTTCVAFGLAVSLSTGGCSYDLGSLLGKDGDKTRLAGSSFMGTRGGEGPPSDADLAYASAAAADVLTKGRKDASAPWENPRTGARGTVTPIAAEYAQDDGSTCREFLASYVARDNSSWLHGEACQKQQGKWVVRSLKPWQRSKDDASGSPTNAAPATDS